MTEPTMPPPRPSGAFDPDAGRTHRRVENAGMWVAIGLVTLRSLIEMGQDVGLFDHVKHGFPWGFASTVFMLLLPKVVSRASYGRAWEAIAGGLATGIAKLVGRGRPAGPGEPD